MCCTVSDMPFSKSLFAHSDKTGRVLTFTVKVPHLKISISIENWKLVLTNFSFIEARQKAGVSFNS